MSKSRLNSDESHFLLSGKESGLAFSDPVDLECSIPPHQPAPPKNRLRNLHVWFYSYLLLFHLAVLYLYFKDPSSGRQGLLEKSFSPALGVIRYEVEKLQAPAHDEYSAFSGPPTPENNEAWGTLTLPTTFNSTRDEMIAAGESLEDSVELLHGGYETSLSVYHDLHCLLRLRVWVYKDIYYPNLTETQATYEIQHLDHCIDALRRSAMCMGDTSMFTFRWPEDLTKKIETKTNAKRICVNWQALETWAQGRGLIPTEKKLPLRGGHK